MKTRIAQDLAGQNRPSPFLRVHLLCSLDQIHRDVDAAEQLRRAAHVHYCHGLAISNCVTPEKTYETIEVGPMTERMRLVEFQEIVHRFKRSKTIDAVTNALNLFCNQDKTLCC